MIKKNKRLEIQKDIDIKKVWLVDNWYIIQGLNEHYGIKSYVLILDDNEDGRIRKIYAEGNHPNINKETQEFCSPINFDFIKFSINIENNVEQIENMLSLVYLDKCYYTKSEIEHLITNGVRFKKDDKKQIMEKFNSYF